MGTLLLYSFHSAAVRERDWGMRWQALWTGVGGVGLERSTSVCCEANMDSIGSNLCAVVGRLSEKCWAPMLKTEGGRLVLLFLPKSLRFASAGVRGRSVGSSFRLCLASAMIWAALVEEAGGW
jgi:hypothetical protein